MSKLFARATSRLSLFWRYFFLLCGVVVLFLAAFSVTSRQFTKALQASYLEQAQASFDQNCEAFSRELLLTHSLPPTLEDSDYYAAVAASDQPVSARNFFAFTQLRNSFVIQCALLDLPSECFLYFGRSNTCIARMRIFSNADDCFNSYLVYQPEPGDPSILEHLHSSQRSYSPRLLPVRQISIDGSAPAPYLTLLVRSTYGEETYGFLYSAQTILDQFHLNSLPADTYLKLVHSDGSVLFSHGDAGSGYAELSCALPNLSCTAFIGIPQSYFQATMRSVQNSVLLVLLFTVIAGLLLCLFFSHLSVRPFRRLIADHSMGQVVPEARNELAAIDRFLRNAQEKNATLHSMLLSSLLVRAFSGQSIREDEYQQLCSTFPLFQQSLRVAVIHDRSCGHTIEERSSMINLLRDTLPTGFLCEYINIQQALILFPSDVSAYEQLQHTLPELNAEAEQSPRFVCGVSAPFIGLSELNGAIRQAQFCLPEDGERMVIPFSEDAVSPDPSANLSTFDLKQFQQALATWNRHELLGMVERCAAYADNNPVPHPEEVFYSILFLLRDAALAGKLSFTSHEKTTYLHNSSPGANLRQLSQIIEDLFRQRSALQLSDRQQLCEDIVQHIRDNFSDPAFCLSDLARLFCVSERFAHNAIQSLTGMNFSSFLSLTRMQEAARLLRETDESIQQVAARCGYPAISTFYRNFKKHYQVTPAEYKDALP